MKTSDLISITHALQLIEATIMFHICHLPTTGNSVDSLQSYNSKKEDKLWLMIMFYMRFEIFTTVTVPLWCLGP